MSKFKKTKISLIMLLSFLMLNSGSKGLVLCFGENGHVSVENPHGEFCNQFSTSTHEFTLRNHKNHCVDYALTIDNLKQNITPSKSIAMISTNPVFAFVSHQLTPQVNKSVPKSLTPLNSTIITSVEYLRTIILLV